MSDADDTAPAGPLASLSKGAKWLGGIIVVAIVGALTPMLIDSFGPEEKLDVTLDRISVIKPVSLDEYRIRQQNQLTAFGGGAPRVRLVAAYAQQPPVGGAESADEDPPLESRADEPADSGDETTTPDKQTTTPDDQTTTPNKQSTTPDKQTTTPDKQTTTPKDDTTTTDPDGVARQDLDALEVPPGCDHADHEALIEGTASAIQATSADLAPPPRACVQSPTNESCGLRSLLLQLGASGDISTEQVARQLIRVFKGTRTQASLDHPGKRELVGVMVDFDISMTGFRNKTIDVRWSLFGARGKRVPRPWLRKQLALQLKGEADDDSGTGGFWVPIPKNQGPFFIRITVYNDRGGLIAFADTRRFR
jgi:hypothetical protein